MLKEKKEADVVQIVNTGIIPRLQELDLAKDYNAERLQKHYRTNTEVPFTYLEELDFQTIAKFSEHNVGLPGVEIALRPVRQYVYGALAAHLLGYVGAPLNIDQLSRTSISTPSTSPTWTGNRRSRRPWTSTCAASPACASCSGM